MVGGPWLKLAIEPLLVSRTAIEGVGDLMSAVDVLRPHRTAHPLLYLFLEYVLPILLTVWIVWFVHTRSKESRQSRFMAAVCAVSALALFKHALYDYAMLLFPFAYGMQHRLRREGRGIMLGVAYLWFAIRLLWGHTDNYGVPMLLCNLVVLAGISFLTLRMGTSTRAQAVRIPSTETDISKFGAA
jgi:hypothetical protein